jgi:hypothetical protein
MKKTLFGMSMLVLGAATLLSSCSSNRKAGGGSSKTGWSYGDCNLGGFENEIDAKIKYDEAIKNIDYYDL